MQLKGRGPMAASLVLLALALPLLVSPVRNGETTGPILVLGHLADLAAALGLLTLLAALGIALLRVFVVRDSALEMLLFGVAVGAGVLAGAILAVESFTGVHLWTLAALLVALAVALQRSLLEVGELSRSALTRVLALAGAGPSRLALVGYGALAAFLICMALAPPSDWDSLMYHLQIPTIWLREGKILVPDANDHTALIGLAQLLYLPLLAVRSLAAPAVLSAALTLLLGWSGFAICTRFWKPPAQNYVLATLWGSPAIILVGLTARVDVTLTLFTLLAHYALLMAWLDRPGTRWLELGAVLIGFAFGVKYHGGVYAIGLLPLILLACVRRSGSVAKAWRPLLHFGLLVGLAVSPWLLKNWFLFHAPFYPFLAQPRPPEWLASIPASVSPATALDPRVREILQEARVPFNLADAFFAPGRLSVEGEARLYFLCPALLLLPLWLFSPRDRALNGLGGPAILYLLFLVATYPETNARYLLPGVVPLTIVATVLAVRFTERLKPRLRMFARSSLVLVSVFPALLTMSVWSSSTRAISHLVGATSANVYLRTHFQFPVRSHERLVEFAERSVPDDSRILMLFDARGFYLRSRVIEDTRLTNWALLASKLRPGQCLGGSGITHVFAAGGTARYYESRGVQPEVIRWDQFERFAAECLTPIYADTGVTLYRVAAASTPGAAAPVLPGPRLGRP